MVMDKFGVNIASRTTDPISPGAFSSATFNRALLFEMLLNFPVTPHMTLQSNTRSCALACCISLKLK